MKIRSRDEFALYLRSFSADDAFNVNKAAYNIFSWEQYDRPGEDPLERVLADALEKTLPLIGLSNKEGGAVGLGKAGLFEDWQDLVRKAIGKSSLILLVPSANRGTLWEIGEVIRQKELRNTIFVMPPTNGQIVYTGKTCYAEVWADTQRSVQNAYGLRVPDYRQAGMLFTFEEAAGKPKTFEIGSLDPTRVARLLNKVLSARSEI